VEKVFGLDQKQFNRIKKEAGMSNLKIVNKNEINPVGNLSPKELLRTVKRMYNAGLLMQAFAVKAAHDNELYLTQGYVSEIDFFKNEFDLEKQRYFVLKKIGESFEDYYSITDFLFPRKSAAADFSEIEEKTCQEIESLGKDKLISLSRLGKENVNNFFNNGEIIINGVTLSLENTKETTALELRKRITSLLEEPAKSKPAKNNEKWDKTLLDEKVLVRALVRNLYGRVNKSKIFPVEIKKSFNLAFESVAKWAEETVER